MILMHKLQKKKGKSKIISITAYDALFAKLFDGNVDFILVGDSLMQSFCGENHTNGAKMSQMLYHTKAVCKGAPNTPILADMPFNSYSSPKIAIKNAAKFYKQTNASAIKCEGGIEKLEIIKSIINEGIALVGHIGLLPQSARGAGGYHIRGKSSDDAAYLLESALVIQEAGALAIVLEGIRSDVAKDISNKLAIPTIGIGSGVHCDGQILVWSDALGFFTDFKPKFVRHFLNGAELVKSALKSYQEAVKNGSFPNESESY